MSDGSTIWTRRTPRLKLKSLWKAIYYTFDEKQNYANNNNNILQEDLVKMIEYFKQQIFLWTISPNNVWIYWSAFAWDHILSNLCFVFHLCKAEYATILFVGFLRYQWSSFAQQVDVLASFYHSTPELCLSKLLFKSSMVTFWLFISNKKFVKGNL